jgi:hypothetical protein
MDNSIIDQLPKPRLPVQQSEISAKIKETQVVDCILNTPVTLNVRELLGSSREIVGQLEKLKL